MRSIAWCEPYLIRYKYRIEDVGSRVQGPGLTICSVPELVLLLRAALSQSFPSLALPQSCSVPELS